MKISVIIPTLNEKATIGRLIESLNRDPYPGKEILVVDGGSTDGTLERAKEKGAIVMGEKGPKCPANARNQGADASDSDVLCFLDGDVERVDECFITYAMRHFEQGDVVGVKCERITLTETVTGRVLEASRRLTIAGIFKRKQSSGFSYANFIRKDVFEATGGFPLLGYGEDRMFWRKLKKYMEENSSRRIAREPESKFYQHRGRSLGELIREHAWYGRTTIPYIRSAKPSVWESISIVAVPAYIVSMTSICLIPLSVWFVVLALPYLVRFFTIILEGIRQKDGYHFMIPLIDAARSVGFVWGLLQYLAGGRSMSRGQ